MPSPTSPRVRAAKSASHSRVSGVTAIADYTLASVQLRRIAATRYVMPLREGGSLPALVEADDDGLTC
jgi:hypothetical protein